MKQRKTTETRRHVPEGRVSGCLAFWFAVLLVWAGERIFRVAILMQGTPPKLTNIIRWAIRV